MPLGEIVDPAQRLSVDVDRGTAHHKEALLSGENV
jgi:hypothetical protein